jgi:hypothetical protein
VKKKTGGRGKESFTHDELETTSDIGIEERYPLYLCEPQRPTHSFHTYDKDIPPYNERNP